MWKKFAVLDEVALEADTKWRGTVTYVNPPAVHGDESMFTVEWKGVKEPHNYFASALISKKEADAREAANGTLLDKAKLKLGTLKEKLFGA